MVMDRIAAARAGVRNRKEARGRLPERAFALFGIHFAGKAVACVGGGCTGERPPPGTQITKGRRGSAAAQQKKGVGGGESPRRQDGRRFRPAGKRAGAPATARKEWAKA